MHTKPFVSARGSPAFSNAAEKQFRVTDNFQPRCMGGLGWRGGGDPSQQPPGQLSPPVAFGSETVGQGETPLGQGRPWALSSLLPVCPPPDPVAPAGAARSPPRSAIAGYFSQAVTSKWQNL